MADEFMRSIVAALQASGMDLAAARKVERALRKECGGQRLYIGKAPVRMRMLTSLSLGISSGQLIGSVDRPQTRTRARRRARCLGITSTI